mgnify:CR=1 FL=1
MTSVEKSDNSEKLTGGEPDGFSETIYINPSEMTKSAIEATTQPSTVSASGLVSDPRVMAADTEVPEANGYANTPNIG